MRQNIANLKDQDEKNSAVDLMFFFFDALFTISC